MANCDLTELDFRTENWSLARLDSLRLEVAEGERALAGHLAIRDLDKNINYVGIVEGNKQSPFTGQMTQFRINVRINVQWLPNQAVAIERFLNTEYGAGFTVHAESSHSGNRTHLFYALDNDNVQTIMYGMKTLRKLFPKIVVQYTRTQTETYPVNP